jgi:hypothetical protein
MTKPRGIKKQKIGFSIDISTNEEFEKYCEENNINKSKLMDKIIKKFLKESKNEKEK